MIISRTHTDTGIQYNSVWRSQVNLKKGVRFITKHSSTDQIPDTRENHFNKGYILTRLYKSSPLGFFYFSCNLVLQISDASASTLPGFMLCFGLVLCIGGNGKIITTHKQYKTTRAAIQ